jgi:excisionase family DNA binding protein
MSDKLLTVGQVAELFRVDPKTVTRWARDGKLPYLATPGGHRRFSEKLIAQYMVDNHVIRVGDEEKVVGWDGV